MTRESRSPEASWNQGEEEETKLSSLQESHSGARGGRSNSFEYADEEEEEDDEVKV